MRIEEEEKKLIFDFSSYRRTDQLDAADGVAVHCWILPRCGAEQFHAVRVRVLYAGAAAGRLWLAHDRQGGVCDLLWAADWGHSRLHFVRAVHSRDDGVHSGGRAGVDYRVCYGQV